MYLFRLSAPAALLFLAGTVQAAGILVTTEADDDPTADCSTGNPCSLREAILAAYSPGVNNGQDIVITFAADVNTITLNGPLSLGDTTGTGLPSLTISGSADHPVTISGNNAVALLAIDSVGIDLKLSYLTLQAGRGDQNASPITISSSTKVIFDHCTASNNISSDRGGALRLANSTVFINDSTFDNNKGAYAGAIYQDGASALTIDRSTLSNNQTESQGDGGAIFIGTGGSTLDVINSTFASNTSEDQGGAIHILNSQATIRQSTFTGNKATLNGGAIYVEGSSALTLFKSTIAGNSVSGISGGGVYSEGVDVRINDSILVNNKSPYFLLFTKEDDFAGSGSQGGSTGVEADGSDYNLYGDEVRTGPNNVLAPKPGDVVNALALNGPGTTQTMSLKPGSLALNAGDPAILADPNLADQRGAPRVVGGRLDIGAYEHQAPTAVCKVVTVNTAHDTCHAEVAGAEFDNGSTATDGFTLSYTTDPAGPFKGPLNGTSNVTSVTLTVSDGAASSTCVTEITVNDMQSPVISCPTDITENATSANGAPVEFGAPIVEDNCVALNAAASCDPASGNLFPIGGPTRVTCTVKDTSLNAASCNFDVFVTDHITLSCPNIEKFATTVAGATAALPTVTDAQGRPFTLACKDANDVVVNAQTVFPVGQTTTVNCKVTGVGDTESCTYTVKVNAVVTPILTCPRDFEVLSSTATAKVTLPAVTVNYPSDPTLKATCNAPEVFPVPSTTKVDCSATASGHTGTCSFNVITVAAAPPDVVGGCDASGNAGAMSGNNLAFISALALAWMLRIRRQRVAVRK